MASQSSATIIYSVGSEELAENRMHFHGLLLLYLLVSSQDYAYG